MGHTPNKQVKIYDLAFHEQVVAEIVENVRMWNAPKNFILKDFAHFVQANLESGHWLTNKFFLAFLGDIP